MYYEFLEKLKTNEPFSFSRWGDGEWNAIFGKNGQNCDGHKYFEDMGARLSAIVQSSPEYYLGMQNLAMTLRGPAIDAFNQDLGIEWIDADCFHKASIKGYFETFFEAIKDREVILVAPARLQTIESNIKYSAFVEIPLEDCWKEKKAAVHSIASVLDPGDIVLFCAGMPTNVMIDELYQEHGKECTLLDMGSVFDPYCGFATRTYHKKLEIWQK